MEVKPTMFSVVGFLIPGIVLLTAVTSLLAALRFESPTSLVAAVPPLPDGAAVLISTLVIVPTLAITLAVGSVLSDAFTLVARQLILRPLLRPRLRKNVTRLFTHTTLEDLVRADMDARESFVYVNTSGLDLDWYAGRVRMMGASGLALVISALTALALGYRWAVCFPLGTTGLLAIGVALYRANKFDEYVAAASAVFLRRSAQGQEPR